jgi:acetyl-CoA carboxylase biotin carboxylase subunit
MDVTLYRSAFNPIIAEARDACHGLYHATTGDTVPPHSDSLIGKLIVHQPTRKEAIETMTRALRELRVEGIKTTVPIHLEILSNTAFHEAQIDTTFVERVLLAK